MEEVIKMLPRYKIPVVKKKHSNKRKTHEEYVEELAVKNPILVAVEEYQGSDTKIRHHCLIHNIYWNIAPKYALKGQSCKKCRYEKSGKSHRKSNEQYKYELSSVNQNIEPLEEYIDSITPILHLHKLCGHTTLMTPSSALNGNGCDVCRNKNIAINRISKQELLYMEELKTKNPFVVLIGKYQGMNTKVEHKCLIHDVIWLTTPSSAIQGCGCNKCKSEKINAALALTHKEYVDKVSICNSDIEIISRYINASTPVLVFHKKCNHTTKMLPYSVLNGRGCHICVGKSISQALQISSEEYIDKLIKIGSDVRPIEEYNGVKNQILHKSLICNHTWKTSPDSVLQGHGCPTCSQSKGEKSIMYFFDNINVFYIMQHKYNSLVGVGNKALSYDFYLPQYNLLIEFQGIQHEKPVCFGGISEEQAILNFEKQQEHDRRKREYAKTHNINLLEIWYYDIDNIEDIITKYLNNLKLESVTTTGVA